MTGKAWGGRNPRRWQAEALPLVLDRLAAGTLDASVIYACTGSGKSILIAELLAHLIAALERGQTIIVSTPTVTLVDQLWATISNRLASCRVNGRPVTVGRYFTHAKDVARDVVVTCMPSFGPLVEELSDAGRSVPWWVADECHRTDSKSALAAFSAMSRHWPDVRRVGVSATPYKSDKGKGLRLWERCIYEYPPDRAIADGALVPWREHHLNPGSPADVAVRTPGDARMKAHAEALVDAAVIDWCADRSGPGVVSAADIKEAEVLAQSLSDAGVPALAIHSRQPITVQQARVQALRLGKIRALVHVAMLVEGVDMPWLRWGVLRATRARVGFVQEVGRYLRSHTPLATDPDAALGPKRHADILDPWSQFDLHGLTHPAALADLACDDDDAKSEAEGSAVPGEYIELTDPLTGKIYRVPADERLRSKGDTIVIAHSAAAQYLTAAALALRSAGVLGAAAYAPGRWRTELASDKQVGALVKLQASMHVVARSGLQGRGVAAAYRLIMAEHIAATTGGGKKTTIRKGTVSDLLDLAAAIRVTGKRADGTWDTDRQVRAFAALAELGVDPQPLIDAAEAAATARRGTQAPKEPGATPSPAVPTPSDHVPPPSRGSYAPDPVPWHMRPMAPPPEQPMLPTLDEHW